MGEGDGECVCMCLKRKWGEWGGFQTECQDREWYCNTHHFPLQQFKKLLNETLQLGAHKIKPAGHRKNWAYIAFRDEQARTRAMEALQGYKWKKAMFSVTVRLFVYPYSAVWKNWGLRFILYLGIDIENTLWCTHTFLDHQPNFLQFLLLCHLDSLSSFLRLPSLLRIPWWSWWEREATAPITRVRTRRTLTVTWASPRGSPRASPLWHISHTSNRYGEGNV